MRALEPYPAYRESGVPWLGEVPSHWEVRRLGQFGVFSKGKGGNKEDEEPAGIPCVRYGDLYTTHKFFINKTRSFVSSARAKEYTPIDFGDVLFAASGETIEEIGKSAVNLISSESCCGGDVILFRPKREVEAQYIGYAADSMPSAIQKAAMGRGITIVHIYTDQLKRLTIALPPLREQATIVRFLDHADRRIRRYIRAKEKLIALLEEQNQAIIHQAVTGRIDVRTGQPYPAYKPSGVEWLGDVPAHWDVSALRFRYSQCLGKMLDTKRITGAHLLPYLRNIDVQWDQINTDNLPTMDILPAEYERYTVRQGDLLVCEGGEVGRCALWSVGPTICGFQKALHRLRPRDHGRDVPRFFYYALRTAVQGNAFNDGHESTIAHLTGDKLRAHRFPFPSRTEQEALVNFLDAEFNRGDQKIARVQCEIELLREYRTRLIADVVTGKLDVREAAAALPEVDPLAAEDADASFSTDSEPDAGQADIALKETDA